MYYPYFRGKQFELVAIREVAQLLASSSFTPIVEPVKETLTGLERTLNSIRDAEGSAIVIINPHHGDLNDNQNDISELLNTNFKDYKNITPGILLKTSMSIEEAISLHDNNKESMPAFIHTGFTEAKEFSSHLGSDLENTTHIFIEEFCGKLYWKHFKGSHRVLLRDGFTKTKNSDYPETERFSDLHVTYEEEAMDGFGDFLIVGNEYSEGGGPAYAVAIHVTYIDPKRDDIMFVNHFISTTNDTPADPAGKFSQALNKLVSKVQAPNSLIFSGEAINEFMSLHQKKHFPGLGYVKKLSMIHHIETMSKFFSEK